MGVSKEKSNEGGGVTPRTQSTSIQKSRATRHRVRGSVSHISASKISNQSKGDHGGRSSNSNLHQALRRVIVDGEDLTPVSLLGIETCSGTTRERRNSNDGSQINNMLNMSTTGYTSFSPTRSKIDREPFFSSSKPAVAQPPHTNRHHLESRASSVTSAMVADESSAEAEKHVQITLSETPTQTLLYIRGSCVNSESAEHQVVTDKNEAYAQLCANKAGSDLYISRRSQTSNRGVKTTDTITAAIPVEDSGCQVTSSELYDAMHEDNSRKAKGQRILYARNGKESSVSASTNDFRLPHYRNSRVERIVKENIKEEGCLLPMNSYITETNKSDTETLCALSQSSMQKPLLYVERGVQQNVFHDKQMQYYGMDTMENAFSDLIPEETSEQKENISMELLFKFECPETKDRNISCMEWNPINKDLLAVSYCEFAFDAQKGGLIMLWTIKNPEFPELIIRPHTGVCCVAFSTTRPSLLAAGLYDGTVAIYDLSRPGADAVTPLLKSSFESNQHKDAVWQLKWVTRADKGEVLVSLSSDGAVTEWSLRKGLTSANLMVLKRVNVPASLGGYGEGVISRTAAGVSLDFSRVDPNTYFAATEDGTIHKCSRNYDEQYLETYLGHVGPIYQLRCSPFASDWFLTCSADWTVRLWNANESHEVLEIQSMDLNDEVYDISWCASKATVFAMVAADGRLEIWDLSRSVLDPCAKTFIDVKHPNGEDQTARAKQLGSRQSSSSRLRSRMPTREMSSKRVIDIKRGPCFSSVLFAPKAPVVVAGSTNGAINVYNVTGLKTDTTQEGSTLLREAIKRNKKQ